MFLFYFSLMNGVMLCLVLCLVFSELLYFIVIRCVMLFMNVE